MVLTRILLILYKANQKNPFLFMQKKAIKKAKITKQSHACGSICNVESLSFFISELQFKDIESAVKNKLEDLMSELRKV